MGEPNMLLEAYCKAVMDYKYGYTSGNKKITNKAHKTLNTILENLISNNEDHRLLELLQNDEKWIQCCAATHLLEVNEKDALKVLNDIAQAGISFLSMIAEITIDEWKQGNLKFRD